MPKRLGWIWAFVGALMLMLMVRAWPPAAPSGGRFDIGPFCGVWTGKSYAYILRTHPGAVLVDAGSDPRADALLHALAQFEVTPEDVRTILLTHGHRDHVAGLGRFPNATVRLAQADIPLTQGHPPKALLAWFLSQPWQRLPAPQNLQGVLAGSLLHLGPLDIEVVSLPGHTDGSLGYVTHGVAFVGDAMRLERGVNAVWPWGLSTNPSRNRQALQRLDDVSYDWVADGHFGARRRGSQQNPSASPTGISSSRG